MDTDEYSELSERFEALVPEKCKGCVMTESEVTFATISVLNGTVSLEDRLESFREEMAVLSEECRYGAAVNNGPGGPNCRWGIACELNPRPSILLDKDNPV